MSDRASREALLLETIDLLERSGFTVSERCDVKPSSFDLVARRDFLVLILKLLWNIDSFTESQARELRRLSYLLLGAPLLVGERTKNFFLETGVAYERHGIIALNLLSLKNLLLEGVPPLIQAKRGGYYVSLDGESLRRHREKLSISIGQLAREAGVSRAAICQYERGTSDTLYETAIRIEKVVNAPLTRPVDVLRIPGKGDVKLDAKLHICSETERKVLEELVRIGFSVFYTEKAPFTAVGMAVNNKLLTTVTDRLSSVVEKKARIIQSISTITETYSLLVLSRGKPEKHLLEKTPVVARKEIEEINKPQELFEIVEERAEETP